MSSAPSSSLSSTNSGFNLCAICHSAAKFSPDVAGVVSAARECALCFGALSDVELHARIVDAVVEALRREAYDSATFLLALNTPITMHFREIIAETLLGDSWVPILMSPKSQLSMMLMSKIAKATDLRPTLNSNLILTITMSHDEFVKSDIDFLVVNFGQQLIKKRGKRRYGNEPIDISSYYTKVKINEISNVMTRESISNYKMRSPTGEFALSVSLERESIFIGGRYLKFSRTLPQSPWTAEPYAEKIPLNSVSEKIGETLKLHFRADNFRFVSCGREDIDVRMLGNGRPFAVEIINARQLESVARSRVAKTLNTLVNAINASQVDIRVTILQKVAAKEVFTLNVGVEEKRKSYTALCYSKISLTDSMITGLCAAAPLEIRQWTAIRVLKRRPLIDRERIIFSIGAFRLDDFHFLVKLETQAGTYVKEFVHGDFGRTRPSLGPLMSLGINDVDILELDVENVAFPWPPVSALITA